MSDVSEIEIQETSNLAPCIEACTEHSKNDTVTNTAEGNESESAFENRSSSQPTTAARHASYAINLDEPRAALAWDLRRG
jgi:hypothetical protein